ncbi:hypothetical protein SAY86_005574 [Trapa natans]|uniref:Uncharacterized protein n=1 Tax=Trapa natans TaxID=22666 RepID=A0AAN7L945_TRANT|nr:hypothetical protein SAY86_005574 [Trapa natans]
MSYNPMRGIFVETYTIRVKKLRAEALAAVEGVGPVAQCWVDQMDIGFSLYQHIYIKGNGRKGGIHITLISLNILSTYLSQFEEIGRRIVIISGFLLFQMLHC